MKHRKSLYICFAFLALATLCACQKEQDAPDSGRPSDHICFSTSLRAINAGVSTKSQVEHLTMESEDWMLDPATRVAPTTSLSGTAGVIAYKDAATSPVTELSDASFSFDDNVLSPSESPIPWSKVSGASTLHVFSYAPYDAIHPEPPAVPSATINIASASPTLSYTVPDNVADQIDLIAATADVASGSFRTSVPLAFDHVLTAIRFKVDFACKVKSLSINGVNKSGTYTIGGDWSGQSTPQSYTFSTDLFGADGTDYDAEDFLIDGTNTLMLMPQTVPGDPEDSEDDPTVVLEYSLDDGVNWHTLTASIEGHVWQKGKRITYTISKTGVSYIYFDLAAGNVAIVDGTYSGKVYSDGVLTDVSGTHETANKYYVYQSTASNQSTTTWTGTPGKSAPTPNTLPSYGVVRYSGEPWSEYSLKQTTAIATLDKWADCATGVGRTATTNYIKIATTSASDVVGLTVELTIDNIWSEYHDNHTKSTTGGITIGPGAPEYYNDQHYTAVGANDFPNYHLPSKERYEKVTLRLKGDNRFYNVMYMGPTNISYREDNHGYLKITSADGDGSPNGSLTVGVKTGVNRSSIASLGSSDNDVTPPCNNLKIYGGTIFAGDATNGCTTGAAIGGGSNHSSDIFFYDGCRVNAVLDNATSTAIGGGGGYVGGGGTGKVTIYGGKISAYHHGALYYPSYADPVPGTAIGGGSTFASSGDVGIVTISGGEVNATSVGGNAIGGGSALASGSNGGAAELYISGTARVTAKSISGSIYNAQLDMDMPLAAANSIGGGRGGINSGRGGDARVFNISGGTLLAGSIGGGDALSGRIGSANISVSGTAVVQGQFIMARSSFGAPSFTMDGGTLRSNDASFVYVKPNGGAVYIEDGTFTMNEGAIRGFSATNGGAVYMEGGTFSMTDGTIEDCSASSYGGAVYISGGNATISGDAVIDDCIATNAGGAIYMTGGNVTLSNGTISNNRSDTASGGGIFVNNGIFSMSNGTLYRNHAAINGGGVAVSSEAGAVTVNITGGTITDNSCGENGGGLSVVPASGAATVNLGVINQGLDNPNISSNNATRKGGGVYASGADAAIVINSGRITGNTVSTLVANPDVANDGGLVTLNDGNVTHVVVTYHMNDGSVPETTATQKLVTATRGILSMPSWSITGYTLTWKSNADGSGTTYTNGQEVNLSTGLHIYAIWTPITP